MNHSTCWEPRKTTVMPAFAGMTSKSRFFEVPCGLSAALVLALAAGCAGVPNATSPRPLTLDTHVDIPLDYMRQPHFDAGGRSALQVDLDKMRRGGLDAAFLVIYVGQGALTPEGYAGAVAQAERKYSAIDTLLAEHPDRVRAALTPRDVRDNHAQGLLSVAIGIENGYSLGHDLMRLDAAFARGARYLGLTHVGNNDLCSSSMPSEERGEPAHNSPEDPGMSAFGRAAVRRANALGMMVDVSHASDNCVRDALAVSSAPVIASHSSARALVDHPRNLPDDLLRAIAAKGGVIQAVAYKAFLKHDPAREAAEEALQKEVARLAGDAGYDSEKHDHLPAMAEGLARIEREHPLADLDDFVAHIRHMVSVAGIDHVGITSDFDGGGGITGWMDASQTGNVTAALRRAGFGASEIEKLWGGNLLRVWQDVIDASGARAGTERIVDAAVREAMERYDLPGIAVGVIENGEIAFARGYGETLAGSGAPVTTKSLFKIASNTKAMTAALLARLVDAQRLNWDDPVVRHLPDFRMHDAWITRQMQVRDLLIHNSGLGLGAGDLMLWPEPNGFSRADVLAGLAHLKPATSFRSVYAYDNLLYIVAGEVAAAAGGADYETLLAREVFAPLGLARCRVGAFARDAVGDIAQPHRSGKVPGNVDGADIPAITSAAAGGVRCSLDDMLAWMGNWLDPARTPGWLSEPQRRAMWQAHMPMSVGARQKRWENTHFSAYGYGFRLTDVNGHFRAGHTGTLDGMYSAMALFPDSRSGYVFLINGEASQARTVLEAVLSRHLTRPGSAPSVSDFALELDEARAASTQETMGLDTASRERVAPAELGRTLGIYRDPWFGEVSLCAAGDAVRWVSRKSPRMHGTLMRADGRLLVAWDDPGVAGADAWLDISPSSARSPTMTMVAIDPATDFSYDFHDLSLQRTRACD